MLFCTRNLLRSVVFAHLGANSLRLLCEFSTCATRCYSSTAKVVNTQLSYYLLHVFVSALCNRPLQNNFVRLV